MRLSMALLVAVLIVFFSGTASAQPATEAAEPAGESSAPETSEGPTEAAPTESTADAPRDETQPAEVSPPVDGSTYVVRMRDLAQRIDELKEQIRRSHTRLSLLSDTILSGGVGGARAEITFVNDLSSAFRLTKALFVLDGAVQYNKEDETGALAAQKSIPIFSGSVPPGDHTLQVLLKLQGHGYGVFSYLRGYKFEVKSANSFTVTEGKTIELKVIAWEKGGVTTPLEDRPAVRYKELLKSTPAPGGSAAKSGSSSRPKGSVGGGVSVETSGGK
jgi:hypothetical protein